MDVDSVGDGGHSRLGIDSRDGKEQMILWKGQISWMTEIWDIGKN